MNLTITTFMKKADGTRTRQIDGFTGASVTVSGAQSALIADAIVERFSKQSPPRKPLGEGGCVRVDDRGIWLLNRADRGWSASAIRYTSWRELFGDWDLVLGAPKTDAAGVYWPVEKRVAP